MMPQTHMSSETIFILSLTFFFNSLYNSCLQSLLAPRKAAVKLEKEERNEGEKKKSGEISDAAEQKENKRLKSKKNLEHFT